MPTTYFAWCVRALRTSKWEWKKQQDGGYEKERVMFLGEVERDGVPQ